jgi:hypothetical protein
VTFVSCPAWSVPPLYKVASLKDRECEENGDRTAYNGAQQNESSVVGRNQLEKTSHIELLLIPLPGYDY